MSRFKSIINQITSLCGGLWVILLAPIVLATCSALHLPTVVSVGLLLIIVGYALYYFKPGLPEISFGGIITLSVTLLLLLVYQMVVNYILQHFGITLGNQEDVKQLFKNNPIIMCVYGIVVAPVIEELVCRLHVFRHISNPAWAVTISTLLFALLHGFGVVSIIVYGGMALFLITIYQYYGIWYSIALHVLNNALAFAIIAGLL